MSHLEYLSGRLILEVDMCKCAFQFKVDTFIVQFYKYIDICYLGFQTIERKKEKAISSERLDFNLNGTSC